MIELHAVGRSLTIDQLLASGLTRPEAEGLASAVLAAWGELDTLQAWRRISKHALSPAMPFEVHALVHAATFADWPEARGPRPVWVPSAEEITASNLGAAMPTDYVAFQRASVAEPEAFWSAMLERLGIVVDEPARCVVDASAGAEDASWFPEMRLNIAASALRDGKAAAVVWQSPGGTCERLSRENLRVRVVEVMAGLRAAGFEAGDALGIAMPMTLESVVLYLAIVAHGGVVVSIADSFAAPEIATRLEIAEAKAVFTQDVIHRGAKTLPLYQRVIDAQPERAIVIAAGAALELPLREQDLAWTAFLEAGREVAEDAAEEATEDDAPPYVSGGAERTSNILFSSGTTGDPKAIPWSQLTPIKAAADGWAHHDIRPGDVVCWPTNLGWMMGPWLIYAALLNGATIALYQGSPLGRDFGEFVEHAGVTMLGVVPSLVKAWRGSDCMDGLDWSAIRCFSSTGEASTAADMHWLTAQAGYKPVIEYCGGTEIGGGYICGTVVQPQAPATFSTPAIGCSFLLLDDAGEPCDNGEIALRPPQLGSSQRLLKRDHHAVYFEGMPTAPGGGVLRRHGDQIERLPGGYYRAHGRVDDTMNLGGIKTSSAEIERVCNAVACVRETAAIAVSAEDGGPSQLVIYVVLNDEAPGEVPLKEGFQQAIRSHLNPLFKVHAVVPIDALPRTASNKVMRRVLRTRYREGLS